MKKLFFAISTMLFAACAPKYPTVTPDEFEQAIAEPHVHGRLTTVSSLTSNFPIYMRIINL